VSRIAYLSTDPGVPYGGTKGSSVHLTEVVDALAERGAEVLLLVPAIADGATPPAGVKVELVPRTGKGVTVSERLAGEAQRSSFIVRCLRDFGAPALYERLALHTAAGAVAAHELGIPHLVELNAPLVEEASVYRGLDCPAEAERLERQVLAGADLVLAVTRPLADHARRRGATRVEVSPNAVAWHRFAGLEPADQQGADPVAVFAGTLRPWHGIDVIVDAWTRLGAHAPRLLVIGDGVGRQQLEAVGAEVIGTVTHDAVPALLATAHIGLAPYTSDGPGYFSPFKLFEYLAAGLAVVAGDLPGVVDVVDAESAVVIPAGDADRLAEAVSALAADPARRSSLARAGRATVAQHHTWKHRAEHILSAANATGSLAP
jgi:glycosyltransferase involved in cell wall biosynthesis